MDTVKVPVFNESHLLQRHDVALFPTRSNYQRTILPTQIVKKFPSEIKPRQLQNDQLRLTPFGVINKPYFLSGMFEYRCSTDAANR